MQTNGAVSRRISIWISVGFLAVVCFVGLCFFFLVFLLLSCDPIHHRVANSVKTTIIPSCFCFCFCFFGFCCGCWEVKRRRQNAMKSKKWFVQQMPCWKRVIDTITHFGLIAFDLIQSESVGVSAVAAPSTAKLLTMMQDGANRLIATASQVWAYRVGGSQDRRIAGSQDHSQLSEAIRVGECRRSIDTGCERRRRRS